MAPEAACSGSVTEQLVSLNDALKGRPRDAGKAGLYMQRARCHMELRHFPDAMDDALDSVKLDENSAEGWLTLGDAWMKTKHYKGALSAWVRAAELDPANPRIKPRIAEAEMKLNEVNRQKYAAPQEKAGVPRNTAPA